MKYKFPGRWYVSRQDLGFDCKFFLAIMIDKHNKPDNQTADCEFAYGEDGQIKYFTTYDEAKRACLVLNAEYEANKLIPSEAEVFLKNLRTKLAWHNRFLEKSSAHKNYQEIYLAVTEFYSTLQQDFREWIEDIDKILV